MQFSTLFVMAAAFMVGSQALNMSVTSIVAT